MPCLTTALGDLTPLLRLREKKKQNMQIEKTFLSAKIQHLKLNAPSINVKIQSEETLTTQVLLFVTTKNMGLYINETR